MMSRFTVQRYCSKNDVNGNPRRVYVVRDEEGHIVATADEGYQGYPAVVDAFTALGIEVNRFRWEGPSETAPIDLGDVDVSPGVYRRMKNYRIEDDR